MKTNKRKLFVPLALVFDLFIATCMFGVFVLPDHGLWYYFCRTVLGQSDPGRLLLTPVTFLLPEILWLIGAGGCLIKWHHTIKSVPGGAFIVAIGISLAFPCLYGWNEFWAFKNEHWLATHDDRGYIKKDMYGRPMYDVWFPSEQDKWNALSERERLDRFLNDDRTRP